MGQRDSLAVSGREGRPVGEELGMCPDLRRKELGIWRKIAQRHEHGPQVTAAVPGPRRSPVTAEPLLRTPAAPADDSGECSPSGLRTTDLGRSCPRDSENPSSP